MTLWSGGIIINPLSYSGYHDIALRDFGLLLAALTLARLASGVRSAVVRKAIRTLITARPRRESQSRRPGPLGDGSAPIFLAM